MMITHNVPKTLWYEAINHATYVHNKSFTCAIKGKPPEEGFTAQNPMFPIYKNLAALYGY